MVATAPRPQTTGPCHIYQTIFSLSQGGAFPHYIGTCREAPRIMIRRFYRDVWRDINGLSVPADKIFDSYDAMIIADMNRWSYDAYENMQKAPLSNEIGTPPPPPPGTIEAAQIGGMTVLELGHETLWLQFPYSKFTDFFPNMPPGIRFPATVVFGPDEITPGLRPFQLRLVWYAMKFYTVADDTRLWYFASIKEAPTSGGDSSSFVKTTAIGKEDPLADQVLFDYDFSDGPDPSIGQPVFFGS